MGGIKWGSFKLIFSKLKLKFSIFSADDIQLTDHIIVIDQILGIKIEG